MVQTGLLRLLTEKEFSRYLQGRRFGLLCHQASVLPDLTPAHRALKDLFPQGLRLLFSPQHGLSGTAQANMDYSFDSIEPETGLPVVSLYGPRLAPDPEHLSEIEVLVIDLQDVGCRVYTYVWTMFLCLKACAEEGVEVLVLDRPNPLGGRREGPLLKGDLISFVGLYPLPMRHGLTLGELALYFRAELSLDLELEVVPLDSWSRGMLFPETGLPWVPPSPNMPRFETALLYPGQVLWEGTNVSEGRGTTFPFEVFGAPWLDVKRLLARIPDLPGVSFSPWEFVPWFDKWAGKTCRGLRLQVREPDIFSPVRTGLYLVSCLVDEPFFSFRLPPYEFQWQELPFDIIVGDKNVRLGLENGDLEEVERLVSAGLDEFEERVSPFLLYG